MKSTIKRPIRRSFIVGCVLFVFVLCAILGIFSYTGYQKVMFRHYEETITDILNYTAANIDADDLEECIKTNKESEKFRSLQTFLDSVKQNVHLDFIYVIIPLNTEPTDNIRNVIAGVSLEEYEHQSDELVQLNQLTGDSYSPETAKKYLDAYESGELSFFEETAEWGKEYTGLLPLYNSRGEKVAALCVDVNINELQGRLNTRTMVIVLATILIAAMFTTVFLIWVRYHISLPIRLLEASVTSFAAVSHKHSSPEELVLRMDPIQTGNEVESLYHAVVKMSDDIRAYAIHLSDAEEASKQHSIVLSEALNVAQSANRAKTVFLSNMSHEIRTPMNAIIGLDNIALNDPTLSDATRDHLEKIGTSAQHLLNIINDILDMSRIESGRMTIKSEEFSFAKTLEQVNTIIGGQCSDKGLAYECTVIGELCDYYIGDDMKLRQILINILGNSVKFTPRGGSVKFTVQSVARFDKNATLKFVMEDTGIGMSKEFLPKIFDSFSQEETNNNSKYGNTGLGMAITKSLVEMMHGDIRVESEKGKGTTFTVTVSLKESDRKASVSSGYPELNPGEMTTLVIDDDEVACEHAKLILSQKGILCETSLSAREALQKIRLHQARREPYDLILVDWRMPEMDGVETTARIRAVTGSDSVIILLTSYNWDDIAKEARSAGVDGFAPKPLFAETVLNEYAMACLKRKDDQTERKADLKGRRILVAEDVAINAEIMQMVLEARGMECVIAENGQIAVDIFASNPEGYFDAILMDMRMPVMDGLEASGAIRALKRMDGKKIPIIALTANAFDEDVRRSLQAGLNAHLSKPVDPESLYETLESLIEP